MFSLGCLIAHVKYIIIEAARVWPLLPTSLGLDFPMDICQDVNEI